VPTLPGGCGDQRFARAGNSPMLQTATLIGSPPNAATAENSIEINKLRFIVFSSQPAAADSASCCYTWTETRAKEVFTGEIDERHPLHAQHKDVVLVPTAPRPLDNGFGGGGEEIRRARHLDGRIALGNNQNLLFLARQGCLDGGYGLRPANGQWHQQVREEHCIFDRDYGQILLFGHLYCLS
jgi:hypothetical protein